MKKIVLKLLMLVSASAIWFILLAKDKISQELNPEVAKDKIKEKIKKTPISKLRELSESLNKVQENTVKDKRFEGLNKIVSFLKEQISEEISYRDGKVKRAKEKRHQKKGV